MTKRQKTRRIFLGIPIDRKAQARINRLLGSCSTSLEGIRWVPESNRHLTLAFLGDIARPEMDQLLRMADKSFQQENTFQYELTGLKRFPGLRGKIIALTGKASGRLSGVFQICCDMLASAGIGFDRKRFRPHVTLGRIRKPEQPGNSIHQPTSIMLHITQIVVYQSTLTPAGSIYTSLKKIHLN